MVGIVCINHCIILLGLYIVVLYYWYMWYYMDVSVNCVFKYCFLDVNLFISFNCIVLLFSMFCIYLFIYDFFGFVVIIILWGLLFIVCSNHYIIVWYIYGIYDIIGLLFGIF